MDDQQGAGSPAQGGEVANEATSAARRRLLRGGLAAAPVLATFVSQPVHAAYSCKSASAFTSANASRPGAPLCNGAPGSWWVSNPGSWVGCSAATAQFNTFFSSTASYPSGTKLMTVLQGTSKTFVDKMARNMVAALLNIKAGRIDTTVFSETKLQVIWLAAISGGGYVPTPGAAPWYAQQVNQWLASVFPAEV